MTKRKEDHTELMRTDPEAYGFTPDQLSALTREEMRSGVTRDYMAAYGDTLLARVARRRETKSRAFSGIHDVMSPNSRI